MTFTMMPLVGAGEGYAEERKHRETLLLTRTTTLDLTSTNGKYMATNGNEKTVDFTTASVNDSAEGWEWDHQNEGLNAFRRPDYWCIEPIMNEQRDCYGIFLPNDTIADCVKGRNRKLSTGMGTPQAKTSGGQFFHLTGVGNQGYAYSGQLTIHGSGKLIAKGGALDNSNNLKQGQRTSAGIYCFA